MRIAFGVVAGLVVAVACIMVVQLLGHTIYPPPADVDLNDRAQLERLIPTMPFAALAFVPAAWFVGALAGGVTANLIARHGMAAWAIAALVIAGAAYIMTTIPHPAWMWVAGILLPLVAAWLAQRFAKVPA